MIATHLNKRNILIFFVLFLVAIAIFWRTILYQQIPVPGDLLVSFYFPWQHGGWVGYDQWTTHKEFLSSDAIREDIPWRFLGLDLLRKGQWPLWNPYNFSGTPLLANLQSAILYPLNVIFFILPHLDAWILYIFLEPFLTLVFTYLFARKLKISRAGAFFASVSFAFSIQLLTWMELGIVGHTILWLPLLLFIIEKLREKYSLTNFVLFCLFSATCILAGHLQSAVYVFTVVGIYYLYRLPKKYWIYSCIWMFVVGLLVAVQILPSMELNKLSLLSSGSTITFDHATPIKNLITFLAPDFFGHPATLNFWSELYGDGTPFFGVAGIILAFYSLFNFRDFRVKFFSMVFAGFLLFGFPGPIYQFVKFIRFPLFLNTFASRSLFVVLFSGSVLAGIGLDDLKDKINSKMLAVVFSSFGLAFGLLWLATYLFLKPELLVSRHNLIIPTTIYVILLGTLTLRTRLKKIFPLIAILTTFGYGLISADKTLSFSPSKFFYPAHPILKYLQQQAKTSPDRFMIYHGEFGTNFATYFHLYSPEGYDSLRIARYGELIAAQTDGKIPQKYSRADAEFPPSDDFQQRRLFDLLGVKYYLDRIENYETDPVDRLWWENDLVVYQRKTVLPRVILFDNYQTIGNSSNLLKTFYSPNFPYAKTLLLEKSIPATDLKVSDGDSAKITQYQPNSVVINTSTVKPVLLFLSDCDYPGWQAFVDNKQTDIYRADYAFRAVVVPAGEHEIRFQFSPTSFKIGGIVSAISWLVLSGLLVISYIRKKNEAV